MRLPSIDAGQYQVIFNDWNILNTISQKKSYSKRVVIVDDHTKEYCLPLFDQYYNASYELIEIPSGEEHKNLETCSQIYDQMLQIGVDRKSLCINLGGGVIGDMGGFCAATFMRGLDFIQIPTTLLSQVDASVGGKLGVDFQGVKNMIGLFQEPQLVFVFPAFLKTLPSEELRSGYAEILKHALIADRSLWELLEEKPDWHQSAFSDIIHRSIGIKNQVVQTDFKESGLRKILNFGHTIGHAVESLSFHSDKPLLHGEAIAIGMLAEAHISLQRDMIKHDLFDAIQDKLLKIYGHHPSYVQSQDRIMDLMGHDKKNDGGRILCSLIDGYGSCAFDQNIQRHEIEASLDHYRSL